jgi:hypothetical protein
LATRPSVLIKTAILSSCGNALIVALDGGGGEPFAIDHSLRLI